MSDDLQKNHQDLAIKGWAIRKFQDQNIILDHISKVSESLGCSLDNIQHSLLTVEDQYLFMYRFSEALNDMEFTRKLFLKEKPFISSLLGPDLLIQKKIFLRLQKPNC